LIREEIVMISKMQTIAVAAILAVGLVASAPAAEWGNLSGKFVYDGKAPPADSLSITKDQDYCGKPPALKDESLVVGDKGGLANVVVWVRTKNVAISPDAKDPSGAAVIDNKHCRFDPHIIACRVGQKLEIKNSDPTPVSHNTKIEFLANKAFNVTLNPETAQNAPTPELAEQLPVKVGCNVHPWMQGWLVVEPNPYVGVSDKDGKFEIKNLPAGAELEFQVWQEKAGNVEKATKGGQDAGWKKGRFKMTLKSGDNDLGEIKLDPSQFNK
jgi:hypothetical protein